MVTDAAVVTTAAVRTSVVTVPLGSTTSAATLSAHTMPAHSSHRSAGALEPLRPAVPCHHHGEAPEQGQQREEPCHGQQHDRHAVGERQRQPVGPHPGTGRSWKTTESGATCRASGRAAAAATVARLTTRHRPGMRRPLG